MSPIRLVLLSAATSVAAFACTPAPPPGNGASTNVVPSRQAATIQPDTGERHFGSVTQLTFGGENAEAYFSRDGKSLIFQSSRDGAACDQQYVMNVDGTGLRRVSNGAGKTTCGFFYDDDRRILFSSTHATGAACPPRPDASRGYVWGLDPFEIYTARADGSDLRRLTNWNAYTAEATVSPDGKTIVFTSTKDGDLEIYTMNIDGSNVRRLTNAPGYDGGPFFSPDGSKIVYRAWHPTDSTELAAYRDLLGRNMVRPSRMEVWVMNADGSDQRQITRLGGANFAPFFTPDGRQIIFSSNHPSPRSRNFDLYLVNLDGSGLTQVTTNPEFDGFPMFSPDGTKLIWASNRHAAKPTDTNLFVAEWKPRP